MERILKHSEARYEVVNEEKSFEKSLIKVLQDLSPGITLMMRPFRLFPFYYPYTVRLYRKHCPVRSIDYPPGRLFVYTLPLKMIDDTCHLS